MEVSVHMSCISLLDNPTQDYRNPTQAERDARRANDVLDPSR